jgi:UDP-3-O-acyl-N-acetylglucosamine deacetylase
MKAGAPSPHKIWVGNMFHKGAVPQKTLKTPIHCTGIGLHSGVKAAMTLRPAPANTGILFRRLDVEGAPVEIQADWRHSIESALCTVLTDGNGTTIMTIEHLMSALAGCSSSTSSGRKCRSWTARRPRSCP